MSIDSLHLCSNIWFFFKAQVRKRHENFLKLYDNVIWWEQLRLGVNSFKMGYNSLRRISTIALETSCSWYCKRYKDCRMWYKQKIYWISFIKIRHNNFWFTFGNTYTYTSLKNIGVMLWSFYSYKFSIGKLL